MPHTIKGITMSVDGNPWPCEVHALSIGERMHRQLLDAAATGPTMAELADEFTNAKPLPKPKSISMVVIDEAHMPAGAGYAIYMQQFGRANRGRVVHAQRARKLRRRGEAVRFVGRTSNDRAIYRWLKNPLIIDFMMKPEPRSNAWTLDPLAKA